jgi:formylglycine-generating enzyme required for sulfatase activity/energy-coupling factor transporter ATP-binding protein EcfA2
MKKVACAVGIILLLLALLYLSQASALSPQPVAMSPVPTPTQIPVQAIVTLTPAVTSTPESILPDSVEKLIDVIQRRGFFAALLLLTLGFLLYLGNKVLKEWSDVTVKKWIEKVLDAWRAFWIQRGMPSETRDYLDGIIKEFRVLDLASIARRDVDRFGHVSLESVYVPLLTPAGEERRGFLGRRVTGGEPTLLVAGEGERRGRPLTQLLPEHRCLVLVGEAGSGKTTFLKFIALTLAHANRKKGPRWAERHLGWAPRPLPWPVFLPLGGFGSWLAQQEKGADTAQPQLLLEYLKHHCLTHYCRDRRLPERFFETALEQGRCLVLLDGLDEVPGLTDRNFVADVVSGFARKYEHCRFIVTCRPEGYEGVPLGLFHRETVGEFTWDEIETFVQRWCAVMMEAQPRQAEDLARDLLRRIEDTPAVRELAENPLRLTVIAIIHYGGRQLPERRARLYDRCVEVLLTWDEARVGRGTLGFAEHYPAALGLSEAARRQKLEEIAFRLQTAEPEGKLEESRDVVVEWILEGFRAGKEADQERQARADANQFLTWVVGRSYLMRELDARLAFQPRAFQEYLAARRLARRKDYLEYVGDVLPRDWWEETLLLTAGHLSDFDAARAREMIEFILAQPDPPDRPHHNLVLAARALVDTEKGAVYPEFQAEVARRVADLLEQGDPALTPAARLQAGDALGVLGDPRDLDAWRPVEGGPFQMGSTSEEVAHWKAFVHERVDREAYKVEGMSSDELKAIYEAWLEAEEGVHQVDLPTFAIARYPATNAQFQRFIEAKGYDQERFWTAAGWRWRQGEGEGWGRPPERRDLPYYWHDPRYNGANRPVVGVTWYEAVAYCNWLTEALREQGELGPDETVRLPTEAEWEKAARGGLPSPSGGEGTEPALSEAEGARVWPWGDEWDENKANTWEGKLETTTPVGMYPEGASPCGALDMVGNVWEWCSTRWGWDWLRPDFGYPYVSDDGREELEDEPERPALRMLRGGSWNGDQDFARCADRNWGPPDGWLDYRGFRCARVSP